MPSGKHHPARPTTQKSSSSRPTRSGTKFGGKRYAAESFYAGAVKTGHRKGARPAPAAEPTERRPARPAAGTADRRTDRPRHAQVARDARRQAEATSAAPRREQGRTRPTGYSRPDRPVRSDRPTSARPGRPAYSDRSERPAHTDRPARSYSDRPAYSDRPVYSDRPAYADRPARAEAPPATRRDDRYRPQERSTRTESTAPSTHRAPAPIAPTAVPVGNDNGFLELGLSAPLVAALAAGGIDAPFAIQGEAIPTALSGADVLARAQTGSGKTLAFGLPMITLLQGVPRERHRPHGLILAPTRELAMQVVAALAPLGKAVGVRTVLVAGGMPYKKQLDALESGVDILVATPGRLIDLMDRGAADLSDVRISVLDEADQMCDMGFAPEVSRILDETPEDGQRLLFSATLDGDVDTLVRRYLNDPVRHSTADVTASVTSMEHHVFVVHPGRKSQLTAELASREGRTIVFVRTKLGADRVAEKLREAGVNASALHGGLNQSQRTRTLSAFRDGAVPVLVATDVAARGIHIDDVGLVLQADPPQDHKTYLHRAGRTARAGESGRVVTLAMPRERNGVERTTRLAGLALTSVYVEPGDGPVQTITGGTKPSGLPVAEYRPPAPPQRRGGRPARNGRRWGNDRSS